MATCLLALYRSKDSTLPDISKSERGGGDIFFDVGLALRDVRN